MASRATCISTTPVAPRCAGARSSALRCSTTPWCCSASCSRPTDCATTRRSASRRTTSSGRAFSPSPRATASRRRSCCTGFTRSRPRDDAATFSARSPRRSRCGRSQSVAPELSARRARLAREVWLGAEIAACRRGGRRRRPSSSSSGPSRPSTRSSRTSSQPCALRPHERSRGSRLARAGQRALSFCARPCGWIRCSRHTRPPVALGGARSRSARSATRPTCSAHSPRRRMRRRSGSRPSSRSPRRTAHRSSTASPRSPRST